MNARPSKVVIVVARWALMAGLAGIIMSTLALIDSFSAPTNAEGRRTLLFVAGILLSLTFILGPFVRRAFAPDLGKRTARASRQTTLLDELRAQGDEHASDAETVVSAQESRSGRVAPQVFVTRLIIGAYAIFSLVLGCVLWALQS